ncbi:MAG: glycosyltransferase [Planctomycetota bacterium]
MSDGALAASEPAGWLGVVVPARNEAEALPELMDRLRALLGEAVSVVVADSGSVDGTADIASGLGARVVNANSADGRGGALRAGVAELEAWRPGLVAVWFVHADSVPPGDAVERLAEALRDPGVVGGAFRMRFVLEGCTWWQRRVLRFVAWANDQRYRVTGGHFGDQGQFARLDALKRIGGVPGQALFEDLVLSERLQGVGRCVLLGSVMKTSPRRFLERGPVRQGLTDWWMLLRRWLGWGVGRGAAERYNAVNGRVEG